MIQHLGTLVTQPCPELRAPLCSFNCRSRVPYVQQVIHPTADNAAVEKKEAVSALSKLVAKCSRVEGKEHCGNLGRKGGVCVARYRM